MPNLDDIRLTLDVVDHLNLGIVARTQNVSQSTVSRSVQRVEASIGRPLFDRVGRSVTLRPDANVAVDALRSVDSTWRNLVEPVREHRRLSVFCTVTASQAVVPSLLTAFRRAHPEVRLELQTGPASAALAAIENGEVDLAVAALPVRVPRGLVSKELTTSPLIAVAAPDVAGWSDSQLILPKSGVTRELVDAWRKSNRLGPFVVQETESHEEAVALAALGSGIGIVPQLVVETSALGPQLREITPPVRLPLMRLGLVARRRGVARTPLADLWRMV